MKLLRRKPHQKPSFRKPENQAKWIVKNALALGVPKKHQSKQYGYIYSLGTANAYESALTTFGKWIRKNHLGDLRGVDQSMVLKYFDHRKSRVSQRTLDLDRTAIGFLLHKLDGKPVVVKRVKSTMGGEPNSASQSRAYYFEHMHEIAKALPYRSRLAVEIAYASGLRSHELLTLRPAGKAQKSPGRNWSDQRFLGRAGMRYTVKGKGGLVREVLLPNRLADQLEKSLRLDQPKWVTDRKIHYQTHYDLNGGQALSKQFSRVSKKLFSWSGGLHGLRHSYAQDRVNELDGMGLNATEIKKIVSQELGHFRVSIVNVYLK